MCHIVILTEIIRILWIRGNYEQFYIGCSLRKHLRAIFEFD